MAIRLPPGLSGRPVGAADRGDFTVPDSGQPYLFDFPGLFAQVLVRILRATRLQQVPESALQHLTAKPVSESVGAGIIVSDLVQRIAHMDAPLSACDAPVGFKISPISAVARDPNAASVRAAITKADNVFGQHVQAAASLSSSMPTTDSAVKGPGRFGQSRQCGRRACCGIGGQQPGDDEHE